MPGILKIGKTERTAGKRVKELSRPTGVPAKFEIVYDEVVSDVDSAERTIHSALAEVRIGDKEFFRVSMREAVKLLQSIAKRFPVDEEVEAIECEILPLLVKRMRRWLRRELVSVKFVQFSDLCILRVTEQLDVTKPEAHQTAIDLRVFADVYNCNEDGDWPCLLFDPRRESLKENVAKFLVLDPYSMIMVGLRLLNGEASEYVAHMVNELKIKPPLEPPWKVSSIKYDMWGTYSSMFLRKIKQTGPPI